MPQTPALILSLVLATIYAAGFWVWLGRKPHDLLFFWLAAVVGFASGHLVGEVWGWIPWTIGEVHVIEGTVLSLFFLAIARWLRQEKRTT